MLYTNLGFANDKISCYVMHKHIIINCETFANEFDINPFPPKLIVGPFPEFNKNEPLKILFYTI